MLLLLAIVQSEDAPFLAKRLIGEGVRFTQINSSGGFFGAGNVALLLGIEEEQFDQIKVAIEATCQTRTADINAYAVSEDPIFAGYMPLEVEVGGAVVFGVPVERFLHIPELTQTGSSSEQSTGYVAAGRVAEGEGDKMKLVVAIVRGEDADDVIRALLAAEHRLTRINTSGGFLRRGNATLLIGVKSEKLDEVINLIEATSRRRTDSAPIEKGIPEYTATIFVLDASHFVRI
jgi:uncharacterized protein YaaQ